MRYKMGIGQDSHRFHKSPTTKPCIVGGIAFDDAPAFDANSDGDVVFHAICNAISTITGVPILGAAADTLCLEEGLTDSIHYVNYALKTLGSWSIEHVAITLEGAKPKFLKRYDDLRISIAKALCITPEQVGIMATTGEGLTAFGRGEGIQCIAAITFYR